MTTNGHAPPGPININELEATRILSLGEFADAPTLNLSEARIILAKSLEARTKRFQERHANNPNAAALGPGYKDTETLQKTRDYLTLFATFKEMSDAEMVERTIASYASGMELFEKSQLGSLVPSGADEAKALIPSLERKVEDGTVQEEDLHQLCLELTKIKRQTQLNG